MSAGPAPLRRAPLRQAGFTLVEVLVALLAMAILASLSWQGLDGILRARDGTRAAIDRTVRLSTVLTQWEQDLQAVHDAVVVPALAFDGQTLRLTRRTEAGVALVAWSVRGGVWQRWVGPVQTHSAELQQTWLRSFQFLGNELGHLRLADGPATWQVYFHRGGSWTNAQSTGDLVQAPAPLVSAPAVTAAAREVLPDAVRLVITLDRGTLTRDIALGPAGS
ncbi:MAG: prepilin-type N-terminal cleavage/methylation domain-containing protein [Rubrivivax sp.]|nr:prepilin-type N-terminal cleavage/methylation domain-containing protein [Rubrivivax sp.]